MDRDLKLSRQHIEGLILLLRGEGSHGSVWHSKRSMLVAI